MKGRIGRQPTVKREFKTIPVVFVQGREMEPVGRATVANGDPRDMIVVTFQEDISEAFR